MVPLSGENAVADPAGGVLSPWIIHRRADVAFIFGGAAASLLVALTNAPASSPYRRRGRDQAQAAFFAHRLAAAPLPPAGDTDRMLVGDSFEVVRRRRLEQDEVATAQPAAEMVRQAPHAVEHEQAPLAGNSFL